LARHITAMTFPSKVVYKQTLGEVGN